MAELLTAMLLQSGGQDTIDRAAAKRAQAELSEQKVEPDVTFDPFAELDSADSVAGERQSEPVSRRASRSQTANGGGSGLWFVLEGGAFFTACSVTYRFPRPPPG